MRSEEPAARQSLSQGQMITVDWQKAKRSNLPLNSGSCPIFTLFALVSGLESGYAIRRNEDVLKFSPQYVMDCMPNPKYCDTNTVTEYNTYLINKGVPLESADPYKGKAGTCPFAAGLSQQPAPQRYLAESITSFDMKNDDDYTYQVDKKPFVVFLQFSNQVRFYKSGTFVPSDCTSSTIPGAFVNVDGYSMDMENNGYYILKFPFGTGWGASGNMQFVKAKKNNYSTINLCNFYKNAYVITAANPKSASG